MKHILQATVWAPNGVSAADWRFRGLFRFVLPTTDLLFLWFGLVGWMTGISSVQSATGYSWQTNWSAILALSALAAFVGVAFPKLWLVEIFGKITLISTMSVYVAIYLIKGLHNPQAAATAGLIAILMLLPVWRVADLGRVAWRRKQ